MANFIAVYDKKKQRRVAFEKKCIKKIAVFKDLKQGRITKDNFSLLWASNKNAPVDIYQDKEHVAFVIGEAICPGSDERLSAKGIKEEWKNIKSAKSNYYDGYYLALNYSTEKGLIAGGDILGLFPIYYYTDNEILLIGSSPELFKYHDCFEPKLSIEGLTGMLMTMHSVEGLTLWKNVHRLKAGYLLADDINTQIREVKQYSLPLSQKYYGLPFSKQIELIHQKLGEAVERHAPAGQKYSFLFSGGLDSRMLGGYLKNRKKDITAITLGKTSDKEMKIAKKVMKSFSFQHDCINISFDEYARGANLSAKWEHGLHGFNTISVWNLKGILERKESIKVISGIIHDSILGSSIYNNIGYSDDLETDFSKLFSSVNRWGVPYKSIVELISNSTNNSLPKVIKIKLKEQFYNYSESDYERRIWLFELFNRARFHLGGYIWKMSFGAWPVIPIIDSTLLEIICGVPQAIKVNRRAQRELVKTYFPVLARLPLDHNSKQSDQLIPTWNFLLKRKIKNSRIFNNRIANAFKADRKKTLYYPRTMNIDNAGWKNIRKEAESARSLTSNIFDQNKLSQLLPKPNEEIGKRLEDVSGLKTLLGFMLWLKKMKKPID